MGAAVADAAVQRRAKGDGSSGMQTVSESPWSSPGAGYDVSRVRGSLE